MPAEPSSVSSALLVLQRALFILPLLGLSAFFSGTETALFSLSRGQRESLALQAAEGDSGSARILWLLGDPRRLITTLILGNEVVNISLSSLVTGVIADLMAQLPPSVAWARDGAAVALAATLGTVPMLILFGELFPKTISMKLALRWARVVAPVMVLLTWALWVPRLIISSVAGAVVWLISGRPPQQREAQPVLKEQELRTLVDLGSAEGEIAGTERRLIHNVLDFGDLTVGKVMTRAEQVFALPVEMSLARIVEAVSRQRYSRVPIYRGRRDNIIGILFAKDLVGYAQGELEGRPLQDLLHPPLFVPRRAKCDRLFREFQRRRTHMALVVDEYGKLAGLVTMEDLLQALFGNITDAMTPPAAPPAPEGA
ncbi:MAG: hemolysin family protein [Myxococcales bacterium]|nr:hemolysin family protein [Myxococcota bacterium]MDW8284277.1 hemolysin family protein [Myxococcales bacterium]